jgi:RNA polymerase sigma factor for flagellar operon FliA
MAKKSIGRSTTKKTKKAVSRPKPARDPRIDPRWYKYAKNRKNITLRNELVMKYLYLARQIANRVLVKISPCVTADELYSAANVGLIGVVKTYDPHRGVLFETYAPRRIYGEIIDELRDLDYVPRLVRSKSTVSQKLKAELTQKLGRHPTMQEIEDECGGAVERIISKTSLNHPVPRQEGERERDLGTVLSVPANINLDSLEHALKFSDAAKKLDFTQRMILDLYYFKEHNMRQIGVILRVSEVRISQLHGAAVAILRQAMKKENVNYRRGVVRKRRLLQAKTKTTETPGREPCNKPHSK